MDTTYDTHNHFLRPEHLVPIRSLSLRAQCIVEGLISGQHKSPYHGFSSEFLEYRPYRYGESTRTIDWKKYAKTQRSMVRLFEDETNLYARILLDKSASMAFCSTDGMTKFDYARTLAASIAWILVRQRDATGLTLFDDRIAVSIPPRSTNTQLKTLLAHLQNAVPSEKTHCSSAIDTIAHMTNKRGLCIIISDFFDDAHAVIHSLRHLHFKRQDIILLRVLDPLELAFKKDARLKIRDLESGEEVMLDGSTAAWFYKDGFQQHSKLIEDACRELAIDSTVIDTREPFLKALFRIIEKRRKLF